jgi:hypothetical protein
MCAAARFTDVLDSVMLSRLEEDLMSIQQPKRQPLGHESAERNNNWLVCSCVLSGPAYKKGGNGPEVNESLRAPDGHGIHANDHKEEGPCPVALDIDDPVERRE